MPGPRILLWDIDGTLVKTGGAGMRALSLAVEGLPAAARALKGIRLDGATDFKIARMLCAAQRQLAGPQLALDAHAAQVGEAEIRAMLDVYLGVLARSLQETEGYEVLPGVRDVIDALTAAGGVVHALGTGNLREGARLKLLRGGLWERFAFGGFGCDAEERADILRAAHRRAEQHLQRNCASEEFIVVGDTPRDVQAAHAAGMACVAVATGRYRAEELHEAGADDVLQSLTDADAGARIVAARRAT